MSPQLVSVITKAVDVFGSPDMMIYGLFEGDLPKNGWPVYDVEAMNEADGRFCTAEEVCFRIFTDTMTCGYSWNKAVKRELAISMKFDENLSMHEDEYYLLLMLLKNNAIRICQLRYCLYCYVQHTDSGLTRYLTRTHTKAGYPKHIETSEKILALPNLPESVKAQIAGRNCGWAIGHIFSDPRPMNPEVYSKLWAIVRKNAGKYYFVYSRPSLVNKVKTFIKHILILLHIHKPRRK